MNDHDLHTNNYHIISMHTELKHECKSGNRATTMLPHLWILPANSFKQFRTNDAGKRFISVVRDRLPDYTAFKKQKTTMYNFTAVVISHPDLKSGERGLVSTA